MKNLFFLLSLVTVGWLAMILWDSPPEFFSRNKKTRIEQLPAADSYMKNTSTTKYDKDGSKAYFLTADTGLYYSNADRFELLAPHLTARKSPLSTQPWQLTAEKAYSTERGDQIFLSGNVHAWQQTGKGTTEFFTSDIRFSPQTNTASTPSPVKLIQPDGVTTATGMDADFTAEIYRLLADVEGKYYGR